MSNKEYPIVENPEDFEAALARVRKAQSIFASYTQEQVDKIFLAAATAACSARLPLAKMAVENEVDAADNKYKAGDFEIKTLRHDAASDILEA